MLMQAKCVVSHTADVRGTAVVNSWAGRCFEPADRCPTNGDDEYECVSGVVSCPSCDLEPSSTMWTCYKCNIPPTCEGQLHHHHHFICRIIQQYAHLREYDSRRAGQQGPIRTLTAALKRSIKTVTACIFYHTNKNITNEKN